MHQLLKFNMRTPNGEPKVSYSQFAMYSTCPKQWQLAYIKGLRTATQSIHTLFGTCFHETLQTYLTVMYTESIKKADELNLPEMLLNKMRDAYKQAMTTQSEHFASKSQLTEFYNDGVAILEYLKKNRSRYFSSRTEELVGIEVPIYHPVDSAAGPVMMMGFLDIVLRNKNTDRIKIVDIKTSTNGWNKHQKADKLKASQLILYKEYFSAQYGFDVEKIDILYMIVKRKLVEGAMFTQKRIQEFQPASGKPTRNKLKQQISTWISTSFNEDGSYNETREYPAVAGKNKKNCKYCEFANRGELCLASKRIAE